jgi:L-seryl-tRNA(Ser) seleniumtransferase
VSAELNQQMRELPSVEEVLQRLDARCPRELLANETRRAIDQARQRVRRGEAADVSKIPEQVLQSLADLAETSLRRVINATGVVLHTNLGRAPLPAPPVIEGYCNLEYNIASGKRGRRDSHVAGLLERLTGYPGILVNNNAAAVWLALNELAAGGEAIVSRGELIEIGDGFRIPDIMARSGAVLREVGTTNRTRIEDYREAVNERTRLIMRVHPSNFHISGFASRPHLSEIAALGKEKQIPVYEDLGSGCLVDLKPWGVNEPVVADSLRAGVNLVSFSGDKLLGGPQAGIIAGQRGPLDRIRQHPLMRALRVDKLTYAALEATLEEHAIGRGVEGVPVPRMMRMTAQAIGIRADALAAALAATGWTTRVIDGMSTIGGGSAPGAELPTRLVEIAREGLSAYQIEQHLRTLEPPIVARIHNDRLVLDLRTVDPGDDAVMGRALGSG